MRKNPSKLLSCRKYLNPEIKKSGNIRLNSVNNYVITTNNLSPFNKVPKHHSNLLDILT